MNFFLISFFDVNFRLSFSLLDVGFNSVALFTDFSLKMSGSVFEINKTPAVILRLSQFNPLGLFQ